MPALRAHAVFLTHVRHWLDSPAGGPAGLRATLEAHWPAVLLGTLAPDSWYVAGGSRPEMHFASRDDPSTWPDASDRWLATRPSLAPGRSLPPETAGFLAGHLAHLGLDSWDDYQHPDFPAGARATAPAAWFPPPDRLGAPARQRAALRALAEAPFPDSRLVTAGDLACAPVPTGFPAQAIRQIGVTILRALPLRDPWAISRVNPLRPVPDTPEARREWETRRAAVPLATAGELEALLQCATTFTLDALIRWW